MVQRAVKVVVALALLMAVVVGPAGASLLKIGTADIAGVGTGYGLIYDSGTSLFWLDYTHGGANWANQVSWASNLLLTNVVTPGYTVTWSDLTWRLPTTNPAVAGYNQTGSEMGHLYYTDLGLTQGNGVTGEGSANQLPFTKLVPGWYWSGTESANPNDAWGFVTSVGYQGADYKGSNYSALAVRPGQLLTSAVPEPSTYLLLGIALGVVGYARRRMSAR